MAADLSPLTGILAEDQVYIDFGDYEGKSILEINDRFPEFYQFLLESKDKGNFLIRRGKDKSFRLYVTQYNSAQ